jgi:ribosomal protein L37AE/L43A
MKDKKIGDKGRCPRCSGSLQRSEGGRIWCPRCGWAGCPKCGRPTHKAILAPRVCHFCGWVEGDE